MRVRNVAREWSAWKEPESGIKAVSGRERSVRARFQADASVRTPPRLFKDMGQHVLGNTLAAARLRRSHRLDL